MDRKNFIRTGSLISAGSLLKTSDQKKHIGAHRSPSWYKFNKRNYDKALK